MSLMLRSLIAASALIAVLILAPAAMPQEGEKGGVGVTPLSQQKALSGAAAGKRYDW